MKPNSVLLVDDSTTNIVLLEAILEEKGYLIHAALSAKEAFSILEKELPDVILLDLLMPKVSGFEFLETIRADEKTRKIPVIVVSAVTNEDEINRIKSMGTVDFVQKPIDMQYLVELVGRTLKQETQNP
jgi:two-component system, cell cycle response regulator DivK